MCNSFHNYSHKKTNPSSHQRGDPISENVNVLERTKIWPWVLKPRMTVLAMASSKLLLCSGPLLVKASRKLLLLE
jgi:hypothetical protein